MTTIKTGKKLIEVALPLEAINAASGREKSIRHGHPSSLHLYWARRPLATARAVIFAQMVDDPSSNPELFLTHKAQDKERQRLFKIIHDLVQWENNKNESVLQSAREEIWASWRRACADNADHPQAKLIFDRNKLPAFHDPFCGGGALPLEAQRLGLESYATDLNPIAVMINKAMIEIPPKFAGRTPVNPEVRKDKTLIDQEWEGAQGLAEDVRYYGQWMRSEAERRIGHLYPKIKVTMEMAKERPDLKDYVDQELTVIAWLWARTVKSPNPAFTEVDVPLASTFMLSTKPGKEAYIEPVIENGSYRFNVKLGVPTDAEQAKSGTKLARGANFRCLMSNTPMEANYIKAEGKAGRMGVRLMAIVAEGARGRVYLAPTADQEAAAHNAKPVWRPEVTISGSTQYLGVKPYGMERFDQLFTDRQLVALTTFSDLVKEARELIRSDAIKAGLPNDQSSLAADENGTKAYAEAVSVYLGFLIDQQANQLSMCCGWNNINQQMIVTFSMQALQMKWDIAECNLLSTSTGSFNNLLDRQVKGISSLALGAARGFSSLADAASIGFRAPRVVATDPPYYDNVPYADLSDFFYVWMRRSIGDLFPDVFATLTVPKAEELVAFAYRHGGKEQAEDFFLTGMTKVMHRLAEQAHPAFPVPIYYAFRQSENDGSDGISSTGWETFLESVIRAGFSASGTWPLKTESSNKLKAEKNALAYSIVLVCRRRPDNAPTATRREFVAALRAELPVALAYLQRGNIAPVDLAQAAIGPGIAILTRYDKVIGADGSTMAVREALQLINQTLDEQLSEQEGNWDADTRWGVVWFDQNAFSKGEFGQADQLAKAKNTSVSGVVQAGFVESGVGKVRLLRPDELPADWAPETDDRLTVWEMLHHLVRLQRQGESSAAAMLARLGEKAEAAKELAYRLYGICERKKRSAEGQLYNDLIVVWPDLLNQSKQAPAPTARPGEFELDA